jgi:hypothetical protein
MSIQAISYVLHTSPVRQYDRLVLISLANHANQHGIAWPSVQTMCHETRCVRRSVQRALGRLELAGEIVPVDGRSSGGRYSTTYQLVGFLKSQQVGGQTVQTPYGEPTDNVGFINENAAARSENGGVFATVGAAPAPRESPLVRQGWRSRCAKGDALGAPRESLVYATVGAASAPRESPLVRQGSHPIRTRSVIDPSKPNPTPPLPPPMGGAPSPRGREPFLFAVGRWVLSVTPAPSRRVFREISNGVLAGAGVDQYVAFFQRRGLQCEVSNGNKSAD